MTTEALFGGILTLALAVLGFLLTRLISQNDKFQEETKEAVKGNGLLIRDHEQILGYMQNSLEQKIRESGFDQKSKNKISDISSTLAEVKAELVRIKPILKETQESQGKIIMIQERIEAQEQKLHGLYKVVVRAVKSKS